MTTAQWQAVLAAPPVEARAWLGLAAQAGHAGAQALLGQWLLDGRGTDQPRPREAFDWFMQSARQGHDMAMNMVGRCYENGWGVSAVPEEATRWFRQAASRGLDAGIYNLANQYAAGRGVPRNDGQAFNLYARAAAMGHAKSSTKAGRYHEDGIGVPRNADQARDCYRIGAEGGDFRGQFHYARLLAARGDAEGALHWLQQVPQTATAAFLEEAAAVLAQIEDPRFRALGLAMGEQAVRKRQDR